MQARSRVGEGDLRVGIMIVAAVGTALLTACVSPVVRSDVALPGPSALRGAAFTMADASAGGPGVLEARGAVRRELAAQGFQESADAPYRVDIGFAVAPLPLAVSAEGDAPPAPAPSGIALCRRRQYVLSIAMIDRSDGRVIFRNSATAHRCVRTAAKAIPQLARAVLGR